MRCGWGPYFRRTFEVQAGNSPLQGQSKPPAKLVVLIYRFFLWLIGFPIFFDFLRIRISQRNSSSDRFL